MIRLSPVALVSAIGVAGLLAGVGACAVLTVALPTPAAWLLLGCGVALGVGSGTLLRQHATIAPVAEAAAPAVTAPAVSAPPEEAARRLRHDIRGALSPALLTADRLLMHADPPVQRAGDIIVRAIEKAAALLSDPAAETTPPDPT